MIHFTCESCGGVASMEGTCQTDGCAMNGNILMKCDCENPIHTDKVAPQTNTNES